ncbi:MAG: DUF1549 domain-containing protein [Bythopirellula sp.]
MPGSKFQLCNATIPARLLVALVLGLTSSSAAVAEDSRQPEVVATIDAQLRAAWQENGIQPSPPATDSQWCRRVYLDLIGRVPTVSELDDYVGGKSRSKRGELVDRLLGSEYREEFAEHWTAVWSNTLIGRTGGTNRRSLTSRAGMADYLRSSLLENKSYDQLARELISASGSPDPGREDYNGAVNFLLEKLGDNAIQATAKTAEIFLGTAVQCTQCHNHPFNEYRQNQFWELNAFFRQARTERDVDPDDEDMRIGTLVNRDYAGEGRALYRDDRSEIFLEERNGTLVDRDAQQVSDAPIYYELRNGQIQVAYPVFIDGTTLADELADRNSEFGNSGYLEHVDRRQELARLIVRSREFDRALVNRLWAHFLGFGFTKPIHDMGPHNPPSHPELLEELGLAFRNAGFDIQQLMRWIVLSEPYSLSSRISRGNRRDDPALGTPPQFSRFYVRQMQAEQLYNSLLVATQVGETVDEQERDRMQERWLQQFSTAFGTDDGAEASTFNGSIPQTLMMMNGDLVKRACSTDSGSFLDDVANNWDFSNREKIKYLYRAALSRLPSKEETGVCNALLASRKGDVVGTLQDIWWAVLNSNEFILVH